MLRNWRRKTFWLARVKPSPSQAGKFFNNITFHNRRISQSLAMSLLI